MSKFTRVDFIKGAGSSLSQHNFPAVYKNAIAALALGATPATYYLCAYYHHQIQEVMRSGASSGMAEATTNFGIMYQVSEHFKIQGYTEFTSFYQGLFSKIQPSVKKVAKEMAIEYTKYLQAAQMKYLDGTAVDIRVVEHLASTMEQSVLQQAVQNSKAQSLEMSAPPPPSYDPYHHHPEPQTPLIGQHHDNSASKCWDKCVIL